MVKIKETPFWNSAETLWAEVNGGHKRASRSSRTADAIAAEFHGPFYDGGSGSSDENRGPENHAFQFIISKLPELVYNNPRVVVKTRRADLKDVTAEPLRHGLNRWCIDHRISELFERLAVDMCIDFGVAMVALEENPGFELPADAIPNAPDQLEWPVPRRISPRDWTVDAKARVITEARFQGHRMVRSKRSIMAEMEEEEGDEKTWNRDAVYSLQTKSDTGRDRARGTTIGEAPHRDDVVLWEVWVPEARLDEDGTDSKVTYNGLIYTVVDQQDTTGWIRKPRPYFGPPSGPYILFGAYNVRDEVVPLGPLMAHREQSVALNRLSAANLKSAMRYKRFAAADDSDPDIAEKVQAVDHDEVVLIQGLDRGKFIPNVEIGGVTAQMNAHELAQREALHRVWGSSDAQMGNTQSGETATAVAVADAADNARDDFLKHKFHQAASKLLEVAAYIMWDNESVIFPVGEEGDEVLVTDEARAKAAEEGKSAIYFLEGGKFPGSFSDLQLEIEPFSMERSSAGVLMRRQLEMHQMFLDTAPLMVQLPYVRWKEYWGRQADLLNTPGGQDLVDWDMLKQMQEQFSQMQVEAQQADAKPRLAGELGNATKIVAPRQQVVGGNGMALAGRETGSLAGAASTK